MKSKEEFLDDCYITLQPKERGAILQAMESYAQYKVNELNKSDVIKSVCPKCKSDDWDGMGQYRRCKKCNKRWKER